MKLLHTFVLLTSLAAPLAYAQDNSEIEIASEHVPELLNPEIMTWPFADYDILQNQTFLSTEGTRYWTAKLRVTRIEAVQVDHQLIAAITKIDANNLLILKLLTHRGPDTLAKVDALNAENRQLFAAVGLRDNNYEALNQKPCITAKFSVDAGFQDAERRVLAKYQEAFPFDYVESRLAQITVETPAGLPNLYRDQLSFVDHDQSGSYTLEILAGNFSAIDFRSSLLISTPYSGANQTLSEHTFHRGFQGIFLTCLQANPELTEFNLCPESH